MIRDLLCCVGVGAIACALALLLTPLARGFMRRIGAIDLPDPRRVNRVPVPRGGGLAVVVAFYAALAAGWFLWPWVVQASPFVAILPWFVPASLLLVGVGFVDDRFGVPPILKLLAQLVAAGLLCWGGARLCLPAAWGAWAQSAWVYVPLTLAWYVGVVNAFNLIDGLDGLSSGLAILATCGMAGAVFFVDAAFLPLASLTFIGALLGFLRYNYNPASVFLGDSGSLFVGLMLATLALVSHRGDAFLVSVGIPVLCLGVPLIDTSLAILRRSIRYVLRRTAAREGNGPAVAGGVMTADREHMHHRFLALAHGDQRRAVWALYGLAAALMLIGFVALMAREAKATVFIIGFSAFAFVIVRTMTNVELWDAGNLLARPGARCGRRASAVFVYLVGDLCLMVALFLLIVWLFGLTTLPEATLASLFLAWCVPVAIGLVLCRDYTRIWGRSTRKDSFQLVVAIAFGSLLSHLAVAWVVPGLAPRTLLPHVAWAAFLPLPLLALRLAKTCFLQYLAYAENLRLRHRSLDDPSIPRLLFYGAGVNLRAYITLYETNVTRNATALIGVLDDNPGLRGRIFRDLPILGALEDLTPERLARLRPTHIVVTTPAIGPERLAEIQTFCRDHAIHLGRVSIETHAFPTA